MKSKVTKENAIVVLFNEENTDVLNVIYYTSDCSLSLWTHSMIGV